MNRQLFVLCMFQNALDWKSRVRNYETFAANIVHSGALLYTAEIAFGDRGYDVTDGDNPNHLRLRTDCELWNKEGAINLLIQRLPRDAEYIAWLDADVVFTRPDWVDATVDLLQEYDVIQMFSHTQDLGSSFQPSGPILQSYYHKYVTVGRDTNKLTKNDWITGLAWASKKSVLSKIGMLPDWCVFSSCDRHIAAGFLGTMETSFRGDLRPEYTNRCNQWGQRAYEAVKGNVSYLPGLLLHYWHGERKKRGYAERWNLMADYGFNPDLDIVKDWQGLYRFTNHNPRLQEAFKQLLRTRNEDEPGEVLIP
jgi:hypothetical protein